MTGLSGLHAVSVTTSVKALSQTWQSQQKIAYQQTGGQGSHVTIETPS